MSAASSTQDQEAEQEVESGQSSPKQTQQELAVVAEQAVENCMQQKIKIPSKQTQASSSKGDMLSAARRWNPARAH